jgi:hypothetical protein
MVIRAGSVCICSHRSTIKRTLAQGCGAGCCSSTRLDVAGGRHRDRPSPMAWRGLSHSLLAPASAGVTPRTCTFLSFQQQYTYFIQQPTHPRSSSERAVPIEICAGYGLKFCLIQAECAIYDLGADCLAEWVSRGVQVKGIMWSFRPIHL